MVRKINGVSLIKVFSFLTIFFLHIEKISQISTNNIARYGVYLFIILSGFLMMYNYETKINDVNLKSVFVFLKNKILKFYPLFLIGLIIKAPVSLLKYYYEFNGLGIPFFINSFLRLLSSVFLIQAFIPDPNYHFAFNGVSWFLDVLIFCYIFTPSLIKILNSNSKKKNAILLFSIIIIQLIIQFVIDTYVGDDFWYYIFPPYRLLDYISGMLLYKMVKENLYDDSKKMKQYSIYEAIIILLIFCFIRFNLFICSEPLYIFSLLTIVVFIQNKGILSQKLNNMRWVNKMCAINLELFLLHQPLIRYIEFIVEKLNISSRIFSILASFITFILIYFVCNIYNKKITNSKKEVKAHE